MQKPHNTAPIQPNTRETLIQNIKEALGSIITSLQQYDNSSKNSGYARIQEEDIQEEISTIITRLMDHCQLNDASELIPALVEWYFLVSLLKDASPSGGPYILRPELWENDEDGYYRAIEKLTTLHASLMECGKQYPEFSEIISQAISVSPRLVNQWKKKVRSIL